MKYRKKPVVIEAERMNVRVIIKTLEGEMTAEPGDWIITGVKGEKYPCKPDIFEMTYEPYTTESESIKGAALRDCLTRLKAFVDEDYIKFRAVDFGTGKAIHARIDYGLTNKGHALLGQDPAKMKADADKELCPSCGALLIGFSGPTRSTPVPGDVSVCSKCGNPQMIGPDGKRRPLKEEDWTVFTAKEREIIEKMRGKVKGGLL
jgi:hypothetical protein